MHDDRTADCKGRRRLAGDHGVREIPRRDESGDADRLQPDLNFRIMKVGGHAHDIRALRFLREKFDEGQAVVDFAPALRNRFALLQRHDQREIFLRLTDQAVPFLQDGGPFLRQAGGPACKCLMGGVNGCAAFRRAERGDITDPGAVRRVGHGNHLARGRCLPRPAAIGKLLEQSGITEPVQLRDPGESVLRFAHTYLRQMV